MNWNRPVWLYCERGTETALFAEPLNAASNLAFFAAALGALWLYWQLPRQKKSIDHLLLIGLTIAIGTGSLLFHLFANQWSELADMVPIFLFMLAYLAYVLGRFLHVPPALTVMLVALFTFVSALMMTMTCDGAVDAALQPAWAKQQVTSCLNGSVGYLPALLALLLAAFGLQRRGHEAASALYWAALVFAVSLTFRTIDHLFCTQLALFGHELGAHFIWHLLNGLTIFLLLRAAMQHFNPSLAPQIILPIPRN